MKLSISGKGGVGKTTIAAALAKIFAQNGGTVYAIDADPDACLAAGIGIPEEEAAKIKPVVEMRDAIRKKTGDGAFYNLNPKLDDFLDEYSYKFGNIRFLRMGDPKKGGSECYCRENTFLHALVTSLLLDQKDTVIMDMGAGIEHLSRGTARGVDMMLVVVEPSRNSVNTARNVQRMARDLGIEKVGIIANKIRTDKEKEFIKSSFPDNNILGFIKFSESILANSMEPSQAIEIGGELLAEMQQVCLKISGEAGGK
ncbi:AAA family ATPase [Desulfallas thermosapovorans]|uniref:CO dehydrogenase maturation factor n=1 Tax=Desulfallas thermosapovorans DSM 6562 TaxID=1121431 RepID=A0A5S4ZQN4_9FIRM|nr:AAA family ATPase [Desulfallas thermosapovorans]TYO95007.1 CO dehydrogenase maturation factor [Desulfallas thermosapovorans DSM 6562]